MILIFNSSGAINSNRERARLSRISLIRNAFGQPEKSELSSNIPAEKPKKMREIVVKSGLWISPGKFDFSSG
jgi:hypothetical protein